MGTKMHIAAPNHPPSWRAFGRPPLHEPCPHLLSRLRFHSLKHARTNTNTHTHVSSPQDTSVPRAVARDNMSIECHRLRCHAATQRSALRLATVEERARFTRSTNEREPQAVRNGVRKGGLAQSPTCIASIAVHRGHTSRTTSAIGNGHLESPDRGQYTESANTPWTYHVTESPRTEKSPGENTRPSASAFARFFGFFLFAHAE